MSTKTAEKSEIARISISTEIIRLIMFCMGSSLLIGLAGGWLLHDVMEYHNSFVLTDAIIDGQNGVFVTYHFESDVTKRERSLHFCDDYIPDFQKGQIIEEMVYTRKTGCESIAGSPYSLTLRRVNGVPVIKE